MCGIAGIVNIKRPWLPAFSPTKVLRSIHHRGPDDEGIFQAPGIFLGVRRLAIIDPASGRQPVSDEAGRFHVVMNGEIYDYDLIMKDLQARGHRFKSRCDTEVLAHLLEESATGIVDKIDGQYAIAAWDAHEKSLLLIRDRMGICPLFYAQVGEYLIFASEMKALFATGLIRPVIDRRSLDAVLAFGCVPAPGAIFQGVRALMPGTCMEVKNGCVSHRTYWDIPFCNAGDYPRRGLAQTADELGSILAAATGRRLKADVPVGLYLSGGIDSATLAAMISDKARIDKQAFTISFPEPGFDEGRETREIADFLGMRLNSLTYHQKDLARDMPHLVYHGESPLVSTESVPLMALSELASRHVKVVLTGEGSDEALGGYIYFRWEAMKHLMGEGLMGRMLTRVAAPIWNYCLGPRNPFAPLPEDFRWAQDVLGCYPAIMMKFLYFRMIRPMVYSRDMLRRQEGLDDSDLLDLPRERMRPWDQYSRTLYLASRVFMTGHLLGSHGDRALMANSVEGRYPFLDRQVQEFLGTVPPHVKTRWHAEKYLLRKAMAGRLPESVIRRHKKPFLAPFGTPFIGKDAGEYIPDLLQPRAIRDFGYFDPAKVQRVVEYLTKAKDSIARETRDSMRPGKENVQRLVYGMALTFVASTQVLEDHIRQGRFEDTAGWPHDQPSPMEEPDLVSAPAETVP